MTRRGNDNLPVYDDVVMDAPPTGRIVTFLNVTEAMSDLAKRGPIRSQAEGVVPAAALRRHDRAPGDAARGHAGHRDARGHRRPAGSRPAGRHDHRQRGHRAPAAGRRRSRPPPTASWIRKAGRRPGHGRHRRRRRSCSTGLATQAADHAIRVLDEGRLPRPAGRGRRCRCCRCPGWWTARTWAGSTSWPTGWPSRESAGEPTDRRLDLGTLLDRPEHQGRGDLRLRRSRQDHHGRRDGALRPRTPGARWRC